MVEMHVGILVMPNPGFEHLHIRGKCGFLLIFSPTPTFCLAWCLLWVWLDVAGMPPFLAGGPLLSSRRGCNYSLKRLDQENYVCSVAFWGPYHPGAFLDLRDRRPRTTTTCTSTAKHNSFSAGSWSHPTYWRLLQCRRCCLEIYVSFIIRSIIGSFSYG
ncbi:hypothetical protein P167DRAFT_282291 [Morchella conica CCBAS932]|uniref:Uncharacterized protein n=1 Tax=Morchella conica CCBAS932 TaxID=1392247 RepID=A0A3N4KKX0_9PEZI|nr:hypothetical protein P167DRAFT_282291 [Morchella conica CCBAS932]